MPNPGDAARIDRLGTWRTLLLGAALFAPVTLYALIERQSRRLDALAQHGKAVEAAVTGVSRDNAITYYAYRVEGIEHDWNVDRADAPYAPGETFTASYLPEDPRLSRPWLDPARTAADAARGRSGAWKGALGLAAFFGVFAAAVHVDLRRARSGVPAAPPSQRSYRRRLAITAGVMAVAFAGIGGLHARDALAKGESVAPVLIALGVAAAIVAALFIPAVRHGPAAAQQRSTRIMRWALPLMLFLAALRLLFFLVNR